MTPYKKLQPGDKVGIVSPSFAAPGMFPAVYALGLERLRENFQLEPVEFPTTRKLNSSKEERAKDLIDAFTNKEIKAVIATIGGNDQVTYIKDLPSEPFIQNPKPFFGYSDNTHFMNFLWLNNIPSFYGGSIMTQFAMQGEMDKYTVKYLKDALFETGTVELQPSRTFNEIGLDWGNVKSLTQRRSYSENEGWYWDGAQDGTGITWGGCLESIDEILRHDIQIPMLENFNNIVLISETSEEIPTEDYVYRVYRALGERGILERVKAILVGRPKAWEFDKQYVDKEREQYREKQRETILQVVRAYNVSVPVVQNMDFGHTDPQIPLPYGMKAHVNCADKRILVDF